MEYKTPIYLRLASKAYRERNKEKIKSMNRKYYLENREKILEQRRIQQSS